MPIKSKINSDLYNHCVDGSGQLWSEFRYHLNYPTKDQTKMADNEKQPLNRHERLIDRLLDQHEKLITRLIESYETFTGERLSRGRANDLLSALEINGLDIKLNEE